ncbi:hypothetical protein BGZ98_009869 [Dissophora globulifera]|nr:hypothetical protein BGZ98_009869 [Dissophora globulifera]
MTVSAVPPQQAIRSQFSSEVLTINCRLNTKTGEYVVLWRDIQQLYENAKYIKNGSAIVSFIVDDDFEELAPRRICHYPDITLEVVMSDSFSGPNVTPRVASTALPDGRPNQISAMTENPISDLHDVEGKTLPLDELSLSDIGIVNVNDTNTSGVGERGPQSLYDTYLQAIALGQAVQVAQVSDISNTLQTQIDSTRPLLEQLLGMQEQMLKKQQQAHDGLVLTQNRIQAVFTQTFEMHEYPIPRLFIVLPKTSNFKGTITKSFSRQFQLFFLCECGEHTMPAGCTTPHEVHLANHEGYDLKMPTEFFAKYGKYLLTMLQMVKYGVVVAGVIVPSLAQLKLVEGVEEVQKTFKFTKDTFGGLVDQSIKFLTSQTDKLLANRELDVGDGKLQPEVLQGANLRQLMNYLEVTDKERTLGNLNRITTIEGHVKWVCNKHYRQTESETQAQQLQDIVEVNRGTYIEDDRKVEIKLESSVQAKQFYETLIRGERINELDITLAWDASMDDLKTLALSVTKAKITNLTINGTFFDGGPTIDGLNRLRRYAPLAQLMSNGDIQALHFRGFEDFFQRVPESSVTWSPRLRTLSLESGPLGKDKPARGIFSKILESCPSLAEIQLSSRHHYPLFEIVMTKFASAPQLEVVSLESGVLSVKSEFCQGMVKDMTMTIVHLESLTPLDHEFAQNGHLISLVVKKTPQKSAYPPLATIFRQNPNLKSVNIIAPHSEAVTLINLAIVTRSKAMSERKSCALESVQLRESEQDLPFYASSLSFNPNSTEYKLSSAFAMHKHPPVVDKAALVQYFREYGSSIFLLEAMFFFTDELCGLLNDTYNGELLGLSIVPNLLTSAGLDSLDRIIERSTKLEHFRANFNQLGKSEHLAKALRILSQYGKRLDRIIFMGDNTAHWLSSLSAAFPSRSSFASLKGLAIVSGDKAALTRPNVHWIISMISAPNGVPPAAYIQPLQTFDMYETMLKPWDWKSLIKALDFTTLKELSLLSKSFGIEQLEVLVDCIPDSSDVILNRLTIYQLEPGHTLNALVARLRYKAPLAALIMS